MAKQRIVISMNDDMLRAVIAEIVDPPIGDRQRPAGLLPARAVGLLHGCRGRRRDGRVGAGGRGSREHIGGPFGHRIVHGRTKRTPGVEVPDPVRPFATG